MRINYNSQSIIKFFGESKKMIKKIRTFVILSASTMLIVPSLFAQEIGEFCWQSNADSCVLKLQITQHNDYFSLNGKQICPADSSLFAYSGFENVTSQVNGSGYIADGKVEVGLNLISSGYYPGETNKSFAVTQLQGKINFSDLALNGVNISDVPPVPVPISYSNIACDFSK